MKKKNQVKIALWLLTVSNTMAIIVAVVVIALNRNYKPYQYDVPESITTESHAWSVEDWPYTTTGKFEMKNHYDTTGVVFSSSDPNVFKIGVTYAPEPTPPDTVYNLANGKPGDIVILPSIQMIRDGYNDALSWKNRRDTTDVAVFGGWGISDKTRQYNKVDSITGEIIHVFEGGSNHVTYKCGHFLIYDSIAPKLCPKHNAKQ